MLNARVEPDSAFVCCEQVGLQRGSGDGRTSAIAGGWFGLEGVDLLQQVAVPVKERPIDSGFSELKAIIDIDHLMAVFRTHGERL